MVNTAGDTQAYLHRHIYLTFRRRLTEVAYVRRSGAHLLHSCQRRQWNTLGPTARQLCRAQLRRLPLQPDTAETGSTEK